MLRQINSSNELELVSTLIGKTAAQKLFRKYQTWQCLTEAPYDDVSRIVGKENARKVRSPSVLNYTGFRSAGIAFSSDIDESSVHKLLAAYKTLPDLEVASFENLERLLGRKYATVVRAMIALAEKSRSTSLPITSPEILVNQVRAQGRSQVSVAPLDRHLRCPWIKPFDTDNLDIYVDNLPGFTYAVIPIICHNYADPVPNVLDEFFFNALLKKAHARRIPVMDNLVIDNSWQYFSCRLRRVDGCNWKGAPSYPNEPDFFRGVGDDLRIIIDAIVGKSPL